MNIRDIFDEVLYPFEMLLSLLFLTMSVLIPMEPPATGTPETPNTAGVAHHEQSQPLPTPDLSLTARSIDEILHPELQNPVRIAIPSIRLDTRVVPVGLNEVGEMDVPDGRTQDVGWYSAGTRPGESGSAVLDAHVYAAFKKLKKARVGERILITNERGDVHEFEIMESSVYPLADVPRERLFHALGGAYIHLITCEGRYVRGQGTYSHRRIVYAVKVP